MTTEKDETNSSNWLTIVAPITIILIVLGIIIYVYRSKISEKFKKITRKSK